uniref:Exocyst complex component Sec8 n=1 Tax=Soboliphyme baturini TaxID=241478 RepID=A0A183IJL5_9BILA
LYFSPSASQKQLQKEKLEKDYAAAAEEVENLVTAVRERIKVVKNNLASCKLLLQCKRDELKRLWLDAAEQKYVTRLLEEMLVLFSETALSGNLKDIEGLNEIRQTVARLNKELYEQIVQEIKAILYSKTSEEVLFAVRLTNLDSPGHDKSVTDSNSAMCVSSYITSSVGHDILMSLHETPVIQDDGYAYEDLKLNPETKIVQYIAVLVESCGHLGRFSDLVKNLKEGIVSDLWRLVNRTSGYVQKYICGSISNANDSQVLAELLHLLFVQFKILTAVYGAFLQQLNRVREKRKMEELDTVSMEFFIEHVQFIVEQLLDYYLDLSSSSKQKDTTPTYFGNVSSYFQKRPPTTAKKPLFRFMSTAHAINITAFNMEQKFAQTDIGANDDNKTYICRPGSENIKVIFSPIMKFIAELETQVKSPCRLRTFLDNYIRDVYLPRLKMDITQKLDTLLSTPDAWTKCTTFDEQIQLGVSLPLLSSSVQVIDTYRYLDMLMCAAPLFAREFFLLCCQLLAKYESSAKAAYSSLIRYSHNNQPERRKISAAWAVDSDISRLLKSLPNWIATTADLHPTGSSSFSPQNIANTPIMESASDIRSRNIRESEILISNLGTQKRIEESEIILDDPRRYLLLAGFQESVEYFSNNIRLMWSAMSQSVKSLVRGDASDFQNLSYQDSVNLVNEFDKYMADIDALSATCLLMLHLEVRVHCFYHLLPLSKKPFTGSAQEIDEEIARLNKDLVQLHDILMNSLQSCKVRYIFEGLGHLVASIFINMCPQISKISDAGKKRICRDVFSVNQCLSNLTGTREADLDMAGKYFELLYKSPDDILNYIVENGADFDEVEYTNLLALAVRSNSYLCSEPGALDQRISRLHDILNERRSL